MRRLWAPAPQALSASLVTSLHAHPMRNPAPEAVHPRPVVSGAMPNATFGCLPSRRTVTGRQTISSGEQSGMRQASRPLYA
jgi:hypothetical protein